MTETLQSEARSVVHDAEFIPAWPAEVKAVFVKALQTKGELPAYAEKEVRWAMKEAQRIERKCAKDIEVGEASLSHAERRRVLAGAK